MNEDQTRPKEWEEYIGQDRLKERLATHIRGALLTEQPLDHVLLSAPAGYGKTSMAGLIADRLGEPFTAITMPLSERAMIRTLRTFYPGGVMLIDEIHRGTRRDQEALLPLLSERVFEDRRGRRIEAGWLTVVAATTERDKIITPLFDRFLIRPDFDPYSDSEMAKIVEGMASKLGVNLEDDTLAALGRAAHGIPRQARTLVLAARDLGLKSDRPATVQEILDFCRLDEEGLSEEHNGYLRTLANTGGLAGKAVLTNMLRLPDVLLLEIERTLVDRGYLEYSPSGRELTASGWRKVQGNDNPSCPRVAE